MRHGTFRRLRIDCASSSPSRPLKSAPGTKPRLMDRAQGYGGSRTRLAEARRAAVVEACWLRSAPRASSPAGKASSGSPPSLMTASAAKSPSPEPSRLGGPLRSAAAQIVLATSEIDQGPGLQPATSSRPETACRKRSSSSPLLVPRPDEPAHSSHTTISRSTLRSSSTTRKTMSPWPRSPNASARIGPSGRCG